MVSVFFLSLRDSFRILTLFWSVTQAIGPRTAPCMILRPARLLSAPSTESVHKLSVHACVHVCLCKSGFPALK